MGERLTYRDGDCEENAGEDPCPLKQRREREEEREAKRKGQNKIKKPVNSFVVRTQTI